MNRNRPNQAVFPSGWGGTRPRRFAEPRAWAMAGSRLCNGHRPICHLQSCAKRSRFSPNKPRRRVVILAQLRWHLAPPCSLPMAGAAACLAAVRNRSSMALVSIKRLAYKTSASISPLHPLRVCCHGWSGSPRRYDPTLHDPGMEESGRRQRVCDDHVCQSETSSVLIMEMDRD